MKPESRTISKINNLPPTELPSSQTITESFYLVPTNTDEIMNDQEFKIE